MDSKKKLVEPKTLSKVLVGDKKAFPISRQIFGGKACVSQWAENFSLFEIRIRRLKI